MALQLGALRTALLDAGASADKAAEEAAGHNSDLAKIDAKLTVSMWAGGILFAVILASQAGLWLQVGKLDGQLAAISLTVGKLDTELATIGLQVGQIARSSRGLDK